MTYVDDTTFVEAQLHGSTDRLMAATYSAVSDHLRMLGSRRGDKAILSPKKMANWAVTQEVMRFQIDTVKR